MDEEERALPQQLPLRTTTVTSYGRIFDREISPNHWREPEELRTFLQTDVRNTMFLVGVKATRFGVTVGDAYTTSREGWSTTQKKTKVGAIQRERGRSDKRPNTEDMCKDLPRDAKW